MRDVAIFLLGVFAPSVVLGAIAIAVVMVRRFRRPTICHTAFSPAVEAAIDQALEVGHQQAHIEAEVAKFNAQVAAFKWDKESES